MSDDRHNLARQAGEGAAKWLNGSWAPATPKPAGAGRPHYYAVVRTNSGLVLCPPKILGSWSEIQPLVVDFADPNLLSRSAIFHGFESEAEAHTYITAVIENAPENW